MTPIIKSRSIEVTPSIQEKVTYALRKITERFPAIEQSVTLEKQNENFTVHIIHRQDNGFKVNAEDKGKNFYDVLLMAVSKAERQLIKHKELAK